MRGRTPSPQPCCGSLHAHNGDPRSAADLARRMIDLISPDEYDAIITNAGGCGSHLRHYGSLLADDAAYSQRARAWDSQGARHAGVARSRLTVGLHRRRHSNTDDRDVPRVVSPGPRTEVSRQPRALLRPIPGLSLVELRRVGLVLRRAGIYALTQPDQATRCSSARFGTSRNRGTDRCDGQPGMPSADRPRTRRGGIGGSSRAPGQPAGAGVSGRSCGLASK